MISSQRSMTATEVIQRNEEKMRILGPALKITIRVITTNDLKSI